MSSWENSGPAVPSGHALGMFDLYDTVVAAFSQVVGQDGERVVSIGSRSGLSANLYSAVARACVLTLAWRPLPQALPYFPTQLLPRVNR